MTEQERQELIELMKALTKLAYGCMLQVGQMTTTRVVSASQKLKATLENNASH